MLGVSIFGEWAPELASAPEAGAAASRSGSRIRAAVEIEISRGGLRDGAVGILLVDGDGSRSTVAGAHGRSGTSLRKLLHLTQLHIVRELGAPWTRGRRVLPRMWTGQTDVRLRASVIRRHRRHRSRRAGAGRSRRDAEHGTSHIGGRSVGRTWRRRAGGSRSRVVGVHGRCRGIGRVRRWSEAIRCTSNGTRSLAFHNDAD